MGAFSDLPAFEIQWLAQQINGISLLGSAHEVLVKACHAVCGLLAPCEACTQSL